MGFIEPDLRGKHTNHPTIAPELKDGVRKHIESIPQIESHYLRAQTTRKFIDGGRTVSDLFRDYQEACIKDDKPFVNYVMYHRIFTHEYNIGFYIPKKDQCELCTSFKNAENNDKQKLKHKYDEHQREKELSRQEKYADKVQANKNYIVAVYDLQAIMPSPRGDVSIFYYKSKLNSLNFTISELKNLHTECYFWHEGEGNRGVDEIASCVLKFIEKSIRNIEDSEKVDFVFYSDNCGGQQKNKYMVAAYAYAVRKYPQINTITHKYLVTGHTQNEGDSVHSTIEKQIKRTLKSGPIYVPSQYAQIIKMAKKRGEPYKVNELSHSDFYSIKSLSELLKITFTKIKITSIRVLKIEKQFANKLFFKTSYTEGQFQEAELSRKDIGLFGSDLPVLTPAYKTSLKIKDNKKSDLLSLLRNNHIPQFYANFYKHL